MFGSGTVRKISYCTKKDKLLIILKITNFIKNEIINNYYKIIYIYVKSFSKNFK